MFGYVKPYNPELLVKEYELYRAIYCGVCRAMRERTGALSSLALSYDIVFLSVVRAVLTGEEFSTCQKNCIVHPLKKRNTTQKSQSTDYSARVSAILAYYKLKDDLRDGGFFTKLKCLVPLLTMRRACRRAGLPELRKKIDKKMSQLTEKEKMHTKGIDECADVFGELLGEVFAYGTDDAVYEVAYSLGMHLGRFIYIVDAADDYEKDVKSKSYNPYIEMYGDGGLSLDAKSEITLALRLEHSAVCACADKLPYGNRIPEENIIKNTVWLGLERVIPFER